MGGIQGSVRSSRMRHLAHSAVVARPDIEKPKVLVHNASTYRSGKCKCAVCRESHRVKTAEYKRARAAGEIAPRVPLRERLGRAEMFLEDGASYAEAAKTIGTSEHTLSEMLPGYRDNSHQFNSVMSSIKNNEQLLELHREIWQGGQYNRSY